MKQTPSPVKRLWELTGTHRSAYMLSIILAILSVACGMIPYFAIAYIMLCLIDGVTTLNTYALWCGVILLGFTLKLFFSTLSTYNTDGIPLSKKTIVFKGLTAPIFI